MFKITTSTKKIASLSKKIRAVQGGTSASKTISILLYLIDRCQSDTKPTLTSVVAESIPHLKRGALRDFENIMKSHSYWRNNNWNATDKIYTFETGSRMEFFSSDDGDKLRGARRDRLFMNEANNQSLEAFNQLEVRTKEFCFLDWNPSNEFWFYTDVKPHREDIEHIILTYKDNEALDKEIVQAIEARRKNKAWWKVYGEGQLGEVEGRIYAGWKQIDELPHEARLLSIGVDFGFTNDPASIIALYKFNSGFIIDEILYQKGVHNNQIADVIKNYFANEGKQSTVVADSAEPKSIEEIRMYGVPIIPCKKGQGSVRQGIDFIQGQQISVTKRSINVWKEYNNYLWKVDRAGKPINEPDHTFSHSMDAVRYSFDVVVPNTDTIRQIRRPDRQMNSAI